MALPLITLVMHGYGLRRDDATALLLARRGRPSWRSSSRSAWSPAPVHGELEGLTDVDLRRGGAGDQG
ncbi:hypothetical protein ACFV2N_10115 [Streptomyces sp. NPDC059680]|uniref:hypothetical protein n=1 Tax=Streptomyces sp. NPDC059680 TaxID=3346904 RepID=UPI0036B1B56A